VSLLGPYQGSGCVEVPYLVRGPDSRMFEVSSLLHLVASTVDGRRHLDEIAQLVSEETGRAIAAHDVGYLVDQKLGPLGLIAGVDSHRISAPARTSLLALTVRRAVVPPGAVRAATTVLRPLFLPIVVAVALAGLVAVDAWLLLGPGVGHVVSGALHQPQLLPLLLALTALAGAFHELGHATASRYGGAEPGAIGVGVYLLWPVFYNDLDDSYRLSRRGRLRADLGGVYFNAVFMLAMAGLYALTGSEVLLVVLVVQHLAVLQQFLPFLRLDGYYVVSDLIGVPDLFGRVTAVLGSLAPGRKDDPRVASLTPSARVVVTAWVLVTMPVLAASVVLLCLHLPRGLEVAVVSLRAQAHGLAGALGHGRFLSALPGVVAVLVTAAPVVGVGVTLARAAGRATAACGGPRFASRAAEAFADTPRHRRLLALSSALCLVLGLTAASMLLARPRVEVIAWRSEAPTAIPAAAEPAAGGAPQAAPPTTATTAATTTTTTTTTRTTRPGKATPTTVAVAGAGAAGAAPATSTAAVPRTEPAPAEITRAIALFHQRMPLYQPNEAQVRRFGDALCTAFDQGRTYAEVKAGVRQAVARVPFMTASPADLDMSIRTAVALFCPGHGRLIP
jgi:putative peptide zinc metalloprotease protein